LPYLVPWRPKFIKVGIFLNSADGIGLKHLEVLTLQSLDEHCLVIANLDKITKYFELPSSSGKVCEYTSSWKRAGGVNFRALSPI